MVGAVNYGSGRRAYDPLQTVAGKTGTCIGQGGWVGLFTSYAPLAKPRLAVVVITEGTDAHSHFPAAVAGTIYRDLNHRFGTPTNMQVADTLDDEEKDIADQEAAAETGDATTTGTASTDAQQNTAAVPSTSPAGAQPSPKPAATTEGPALRGTVKRVLMPIEKRNEPVTNATGPSPAPAKTPEQVAPGQRPRRAQPLQP
jgi:hypothetical protein